MDKASNMLMHTRTSIRLMPRPRPTRANSLEVMAPRRKDIMDNLILNTSRVMY